MTVCLSVCLSIYLSVWLAGSLAGWLLFIHGLVPLSVPQDRSSIALPGNQAQLVAAALATGKPIVAVILSGGSVSVDALAGAPNAAVVYAGFGGESGQNAIVDVLCGDTAASGRLPFTVYPESWGNATKMNVSIAHFVATPHKAPNGFQAHVRCGNGHGRTCHFKLGKAARTNI
eukprot:COSAG02_NODE_1759_length_11042_cov_3.648725_7_plen_174_part_00